MDTDTMSSLRNVIEYLRDDEKRNYEECEDPTAKEHHIYNDVLALERYLDEG